MTLVIHLNVVVMVGGGAGMHCRVSGNNVFVKSMSPSQDNIWQLVQAYATNHS